MILHQPPASEKNWTLASSLEGTRSARPEMRNLFAEVHNHQIMGGVTMHERDATKYHWKTPQTHHPTQPTLGCGCRKGGNFRTPVHAEAPKGR